MPFLSGLHTGLPCGNTPRYTSPAPGLLVFFAQATITRPVFRNPFITDKPRCTRRPQNPVNQPIDSFSLLSPPCRNHILARNSFMPFSRY